MFDKIQMILMMKTSISNNRISHLNKTVLLIFWESFEKIYQGYPINFSQFYYRILKTALRKSEFRISFRGLSILNNFLQIPEKEIESLPLLSLNWNWICFLLTIKFQTFEIFQQWVRKIPLTERGLMKKA